jgi:hypothetical protein
MNLGGGGRTEGTGGNVYTTILEIVISNTAEQITEHKYIHTQKTNSQLPL